MKKLNAPILLMSSAMLLSVPAMAYDAGDILMRVGAVSVNPEKKSDDIDQVPGQAVEADYNTQLGLSATYMITDKFGVEVLAATPFTHEITARNGTLGSPGADLGEVKQLPPTISAQYYFMDKTSAIQPYVGGGLNITIFFDEEAGKDAKALGYDKLSLDDSYNLAVQAGIDYSFNENMFVNASAMYAKIGTTATLKGSSGELDVDYNLDPMVYRLNFGYKF